MWGCHQSTLIEAARRIATIARRMGALVTTTDRWYSKLERRNPKAWHFNDTPSNREVIVQDLKDMVTLAVMLQSPGHLRDVPTAWRQILLRDSAADGGIADPDLLCPVDTAPIIGDQFASAIAYQGFASCRAVEKCVERLKKSGREPEAEQLLSQHQMTFEELNECFELSCCLEGLAPTLAAAHTI